MERMIEEIPKSEYRAYQHFITNSEWDHKGVIAKVARDTSELLERVKKKSKKPTGLIIDESAHLKKGSKSVGVGRQYAGVIGKVDNCQVGVYASLVNDRRAWIVNERLFLPESWVKDKIRCKLAGIPKEEIRYKTKPELALEMIDEMVKGDVKFDWVGGAGLYGNNRALRKGLDQLGLLYVLDIHKMAPIRVDEYMKQLGPGDWKTEKKILIEDIKLNFVK